MPENYERYTIHVSEAEKWMDRPIKVEFRTPYSNGYNSTVIYLDEAERTELILALEASR